jgi:hypothetical protein
MPRKTEGFPVIFWLTRLRKGTGHALYAYHLQQAS